MIGWMLLARLASAEDGGESAPELEAPAAPVSPDGSTAPDLEGDDALLAPPPAPSERAPEVPAPTFEEASEYTIPTAPTASVEAGASAGASANGIVQFGAPNSGNVYVIQPGDTLWDVSSRFLADPQAWPQLWSVNAYITNPHWIYPGNVIRFQLGDALTPPAASVVMDSEEPSVRAPKPEPSGEWTGATCGFPPRFNRSMPGMTLVAPGVLGDDAALNLRGEVVAASVPGTHVGEGQYVYVEMKDAPSLECGEPLTIYRQQAAPVMSGKVRFGWVYRVLATGTVVRVDDRIVTLRLRDSFFEVRRGDRVGDSMPVDLRLDVQPPGIAGLEATVVARLGAEEQALAAVGETVFLDKGSDAGIDVGQSLFVVERRDGLSMIAPENPRLPEQVVGRVVVVRSEPLHATAVVVDAARDVQVGARITTRPNGE